MSLLELKNVTLCFGGLTAVNDVSLSVPQGEIFSVIGPNGAGKTSLFNSITGIYTPTRGSILFQGRDVRRAFTLRTLAGLLVIAVAAFFGALISLHIEELWETAIIGNYVYQEPFPWMKAVADFRSLLLQLLTSRFDFVAGAAGILGFVGAAVVWQRARRSPEVVALSGVSRTFQNIRLFQNMTALENVLVGMDRNLHAGFFDCMLRLPKHFRENRSSTARAREMLEFVGLEQYEDSVASCLPYGYQRRLEIARALASNPILLLLDEPAAGMNPSESVDLMELITKIKAKGVTVLLIEHHMRVVMGISDRIAVLDYGNKIAEGTPEEIRCNSQVISAYLGKA